MRTCALYVCTRIFTELCSQVLNNVIKCFQEDTLLWAVTRVTLIQKAKPTWAHALCNETATQPCGQSLLGVADCESPTLLSHQEALSGRGPDAVIGPHEEQDEAQLEFPLHLNKYRTARTIRVGSFGRVKIIAKIINTFFPFVFQIFYPETTDVYDRKNIPRMIYCIHALRWEKKYI